MKTRNCILNSTFVVLALSSIINSAMCSNAYAQQSIVDPAPSGSYGGIMESAVSVFIQEPDDRFFLERPKVALGLSHELTREERTNPNPSGDTVDTKSEFREMLQIATNGWIYHPGFWSFRLSFEPEWAQTEDEREYSASGFPTESRSRNVYLPAYFLDTTFLSVKPYTLHLFANRHQTKLRSAFAKDSETTSDVYGADLTLKNVFLPTYLRYSHFSSEESGFYISDTEADDAQLSIFQRTQKSHTRLRSVYQNSDRSTQVPNGSPTSTNITSWDHDLRNTYDFWANRELLLDTNILLRDSTTDLVDTSNRNAAGRLYWQHAQNLRSDYSLGYDRYESDFYKTTTWSERAGLSHRLYDNLVTVLNVRGSQSESSSGSGQDNATDKSLGGGINLDYRRAIPRGTLNLWLGEDYQRTYRDRGIQVTQETIVLQSSQLTELANAGVDVSSILVMDAGGSIRFVEGIDYTVEERDHAALIFGIRPTPTGALSAGGGVRVTYRYEPSASYDDARLAQNYGIGFELWNSFAISYGYSKVRQELLSDIPVPNLVDDTTQIVNIRYDRGWSETALAWEQVRRRVAASSRTRRATQTFTLVPSREVFVRLTGRYSHQDLTDTSTDVSYVERSVSARSEISWQARNWLIGTFGGSWERQSGLAHKSELVGVDPSFEARWGVWTGIVRLSYVVEDINIDRIDEQRRKEFTQYLEIRRSLW